MLTTRVSPSCCVRDTILQLSSFIVHQGLCHEIPMPMSTARPHVGQKDIGGRQKRLDSAGESQLRGNISPLLWNLVMDVQLTKITRRGLQTLGQANDLIIVASSLFLEALPGVMQVTLKLVV